MQIDVTENPNIFRDICQKIVESKPDIYYFRYWHLLTDKPIPHRHDLQTNNAYAARHYWKLKKFAEEFLSKDNKK